MRTFTDVFTRIKNDYVEEVSDDELLVKALPANSAAWASK